MAPVIFALCAALARAPETPTAERGTYTIPGHGALRIKVPEGWVDQATSVATPPSLQVRLGPSAGSSFSLQMTAAWLDPEKLQTETPERIKAATLQAAAALLPRSVEGAPTPEELRGAESNGYYFSLTDRNPPPGEYAYVVQGVAVTGELLVVFTFLHRTVPSKEREQALQLLGTALYLRGGSVISTESRQ